MRLDDLIEMLSKEDKKKVLKLGFRKPHSHRANYNELAFEPAENVTVGEMLKAAKSALGKTFTGWKGGDFTMLAWTECNLAYEGKCGEEISERLLKYMLADVVKLENQSASKRRVVTSSPRNE